MVIDKTRLVHIAYQILRAESWSIPGIRKTFIIFSFKSKLQAKVSQAISEPPQ
jgi:hypothetical protein